MRNRQFSLRSFKSCRSLRPGWPPFGVPIPWRARRPHSTGHQRQRGQQGRPDDVPMPAARPPCRTPCVPAPALPPVSRVRCPRRRRWAGPGAPPGRRPGGPGPGGAANGGQSLQWERTYPHWSIGASRGISRVAAVEGRMSTSHPLFSTQDPTGTGASATPRSSLRVARTPGLSRTVPP